MTRTTYTFECTEARAELVRRTLALHAELEQLALTAPDGSRRRCRICDRCQQSEYA